jgi:hypothetical protein
LVESAEMPFRFNVLKVADYLVGSDSWMSSCTGAREVGGGGEMR